MHQLGYHHREHFHLTLCAMNVKLKPILSMNEQVPWPIGIVIAAICRVSVYYSKCMHTKVILILYSIGKLQKLVHVHDIVKNNIEG